MHIAILHYSAPPIIGGVESVIRAHTELLLADGHQVTIFAGRGSTFDQRAPVQLIPLLDSIHPDILSIGQTLARGIIDDRFRQIALAIRSQLRTNLAVADVLIAHNVLSLHKNLALTSALWHMQESGVNIPTVAWCHDLAWTNPQYLPDLHEGEPWLLLKRPLPGAYYVCDSQERAGQLADLWGGHSAQLRIIPIGIDADAFLCLSRVTKRLVWRYRLWEQDLVLLLPARLTRRKNIELAIRTTASLVARGLAVRLIITGPPGPHNIGNKQYMQELDDLRHRLGVADAALLLYLDDNERGHSKRISDRVVADLYTISDALLFPSKQEGFGIPVLEAGLSRLPLFCSHIAPLQALAGDSAHYFGPDDSADVVADAIEQWMQSDPAYLLRRRVRQTYTWQAVYERHIAPFLAEVVK